MAKDVTRTSKWHSFYEGPFEVVRRNTGGAYILKDRANSILPFRFPPSHLKLVTKEQPLVEKSYPIKKIISHAAIENEPYKFDYYVLFDIPDTTPVWISSDMFDSRIPIERYWKTISKANLKATTNNASTTRDAARPTTTPVLVGNAPVDQPADNADDDQPFTHAEDIDRPMITADEDDQPFNQADDLDQPNTHADDIDQPMPTADEPDRPDHLAEGHQADPTAVAVIPLKKRKPTWTYQDSTMPASKDILASPSSKRTRRRGINVFGGGSVGLSTISEVNDPNFHRTSGRECPRPYQAPWEVVDVSPLGRSWKRCKGQPDFGLSTDGGTLERT